MKIRYLLLKKTQIATGL